MENKLTLKDLIDELNKVVKEYGYTRIKEITLNIGNGDNITYHTDICN
jgi:hypothetical protein